MIEISVSHRFPRLTQVYFTAENAESAEFLRLCSGRGFSQLGVLGGGFSRGLATAETCRLRPQGHFNVLFPKLTKLLSRCLGLMVSGFGLTGIVVLGIISG